MSLFSYAVFKTAAEQKSFLKAAETLNLTPSAVSHSISNLEKEMGFPLFVRNKNYVELTSDGKSMLPSVRAVLNGEERVKQEAALIQGLDKGIVRIGTFSSVCINFIPGIVKSYRKLYPEIQIIVFQGGYSDCFHWIKTGIVDIGFIPLPTTEKLYVEPLTRDRLLCVTPKDFKTEHHDYITMDEIKHQTFIMQRDDYDKDTKGLLNKYGISVYAPFYSIDDASIAALIESGIGIGIMPELALKKISNDINTYPFKPCEYRTIGLAALKKQSLSPASLKMFARLQ